MNHPYQTPFQIITIAGEVADGPDGTSITSPPGSIGEVTDSQLSTIGIIYTIYLAKFPAQDPADGEVEVYLYEYEVDDRDLYTRINTKFCPSCGSHDVESMEDGEGFWGCNNCFAEYLPTHPANQNRPSPEQAAGETDNRPAEIGVAKINEFFSFFSAATPSTFRSVWGDGLGEHLWDKFVKVNKGDVRKFWSDLDSVCRKALVKHLWA